MVGGRGGRVLGPLYVGWPAEPLYCYDDDDGKYQFCNLQADLQSGKIYLEHNLDTSMRGGNSFLLP